jgi:hypothetical protein
MGKKARLFLSVFIKNLGDPGYAANTSETRSAIFRAANFHYSNINSVITLPLPIAPKTEIYQCATQSYDANRSVNI